MITQLQRLTEENEKLMKRVKTQQQILARIKAIIDRNPVLFREIAELVYKEEPIGL